MGISRAWGILSWGQRGPACWVVPRLPSPCSPHLLLSLVSTAEQKWEESSCP